MSWCVVMMQLPHFRCPEVRSLAPHSITKATKDFQVVLFVNVLALWCVLVMHHSTGIKENGQHHFDVAPHLPGFLASGMLNVATVTTAPWFPGRTRKPTTHHQWSRYSGIRGSCLRSPACPARLPDGVASAPSLAASARISRTLSARPNHRSKWNVPNQCLSPPPPQVLGRWHDGPAW